MLIRSWAPSDHLSDPLLGGCYARSEIHGGVLTSRKNVSSDLWIVRIRPEDKIPFSPGQYVTVGLPKNGRMVERPYSVASSPTEAELEFFIEVVPDGELTPNLHEVPVGGEVFFRRSAKGRFLLDEKSCHQNHFMMATVTGVAPYVSMLRSLVERAGQGETVAHQIVLLEAASLASELGYDEELAAYARSYEWFH